MTPALLSIQQGFLRGGIPIELVDELIAAFSEAKRRYFLGDFRPQAVEGGRFTEAALRILQWATSGTYTPVGDSRFKADLVIRGLEQLPTTGAVDSARLHIPRALRVIYDVRNKRNTAHLSDGIDPNRQDATLVVGAMNWVMAEFVRLYEKVTPAEAQETIDALVQREVPLIEMFEGKPRIMADLPASDHALVLLYWVGEAGVLRRDLAAWMPPKMRTNLTRTLSGLHEKYLIHFQDPVVKISQVGVREVEARRLIQSV